MDILPEEIHQDILLLLLILHEAGGGPLAEELHEASLHDEPAHAGQVEEEGEDDEVERHPLVVGVVHDGDAVLLPLLQRDAPELHAGGAGALVGLGDVPGGVHPAVGVQHAPVNTVRGGPSVTLDGLPEKLPKIKQIENMPKSKMPI